MATQKLKYLRSKSTANFPMVYFEDEYELQYNEDHIVEKVKVGEVDICKEVNSHFNEVGLQNAIKNAIARGQDPYTIYGKYEPGVPVSIDPNATLEDIETQISTNDKKYESIAKSLGVSVEQLKEAINTPGALNQLISAAKEKPAEVEKEGE